MKSIGSKLALSYNRIKSKLGLRLDLSLFFPSGFFTWHRRPKTVSGIGNLNPLSGLVLPSIAIVMQGPIDRKHDFTISSLRIYRQMFPDAILILSTWTNSKPDSLKTAASMGVEVVLTEPIDSPEHGNISRQVATTLAGVRRAAELGAKRILKTRTDQRIYSPTSLALLEGVLQLFPVGESASGGLVGRIVCTTMNTFLDRPLSISDFLQYGYTLDVVRFWESAFRHPLPNTLAAEQLLTGGLLLDIGWAPGDLFSESSWMLAIREIFGFVDASALDLYWHKYSRREYLWRRYANSVNQEITHGFWLYTQI